MRSFDRATVQAVLQLFEVDGSDFYYNESNDYGVITLKLFVGAGDPFKLYAGPETRAWYAGRGGNVFKGTGRYKLNGAVVEQVMQMLEKAK